jgi:two-component system, chemotaxis family, protein-glutamate methylesterase/glutaminase
MTNTESPRPLAAVVLGGSAGCVDVLLTLLPAFEPECGVPVLLVVHLPRARPSRLVELFAPRCRLPILEAEDKLPLAPGTIYVAPPDYHLLVDAGPQLALAADELVNHSRPSIDVLFESAADAFGSAVLGVVLSGANSDGAAGLAAIARAGGLALVQEPAEAVATAMPEAALKAVPQSCALSVAKIAEELRAIRAGLYSQQCAPRVSP